MKPDRSCEEAGIAPSHCTRDVVPAAFYNCDLEVQRRFELDVQSARSRTIGAPPRTDFNLGDRMRLDDPSDEQQLLSALNLHFPRILAEIDSQLLLAFLDIDGDGTVSAAEWFPILSAGAVHKGTSDSVKQFWCASSASRVLQTIRTMNIAYTKESRTRCRMFTLLKLDKVLVSRPKNKQFRAAALSLSFTVHQGDPPSRYEFTLSGNAENDLPRRRWWKMGSLYALTRYHKYQHCTPKGLEAEFCVCS
eukprot:TRINITY_DN66375_c0_g1_i1.p1 TRINITY_DN66375_c0_g1~~TRINITY_DN66375_c0_g1_i1.p1  ORF type:complete len:256 (+),score=6.24 TRINITY_DN66375_c0_g1_i1:23-769(+)